MKKFFQYALACTLAFTAYACSEDENTPTPPPSKGEQAVEQVINVLEEKPELSQFAELLKTADVSDLQEEKLTVFAVKNETAAWNRSRALAMDSTALKRHIAKGSYTKDQLTDGTVLKSINEENLYITREGNAVSVNGVEIEGEAIPAGNSYIYVVPEIIESQAEPTIPQDSVSVNDISYLWRNTMNNYLFKNWEVEAKLTTGYGGFTYNDIAELSDEYWNTAYQTLAEGEKYLAQLAESEEGRNLSDTIKVEKALIQTQLYGYYGKYVDGENVCTADDLILSCETLVDLLPGAMRDAASLLSAKVLLYNEQYAGAVTYSEMILANGNYALGENEVIWKGYTDAFGSSVDPLLLQEVYIIAAIAHYKNGNVPKALELLNVIAEPPISSIEDIDTSIYLNLLKGTGETYPYYRLLTSMDISVSYPLDFGFDISKHLLLPVPQDALNENTGLIQNPNYDN